MTPRPTRRAVASALLLALGLAVFMQLLEYTKVLFPLEAAALRLFYAAGLSRSTPDAVIHLVVIDNQDYRDYFGTRSPIDPETLLRLIGEIALGRPAVIGVDIDTSHPDFSRVKDRARFDVPIVWAQTGTERDIQPYIDPWSWFWGRHRIPVMEPHPTIAGDDPRHTGLVTIPEDSDLRVRRYYTGFIEEGSRHALRLSFPARIVQTFRGAPEYDGHAHELLFDFTTDRYEFLPAPARDFLSGKASNLKEVLNGRIVIVGGNYDAARDFYETPVGRRTGVELMAAAVRSELKGSGKTEVPPWLMLAIDFAVGMGITFGIKMRPSQWRVWSLCFAGLLLSLALFHWFQVFLNVLVIAAAIYLHHLAQPHAGRAAVTAS